MSGFGPQSNQSNLESSTNPVPDWYGSCFDVPRRQQHHQQNYGSQMYPQTSQGPYIRPTVQSDTRVWQHPSASGLLSARTGQNAQSSEGTFRSMPQHTSSQEFHHQQRSAQASKQQQQAHLPPYQPFVGTQSGTEDMLIGARIVEQQFYRAPDVMQAPHPNFAKNLQQNEHPIHKVGINSSHKPQDIPHLTQMLGGKNTTTQKLSATYPSQQYTYLTSPVLEDQQQGYDNDLLYQRNQSNHRRNQSYASDPGKRTQQKNVYNIPQLYLSEQQPYYSIPQLSGAQKARTVPNYPQTSVDMSVYAHVPRNVPVSSEALVNLSIYSQVNSQGSLNMPVYTQGSRSVSVQPSQQQQQQQRQKGTGLQQQYYNNYFPFSRTTEDMAAAELNVHKVMAGYARSQIRQRNTERSETATQEDLSKIRSVFAVPRSSEQANDRSVLQKWYAEPSSAVPEASVLEDPPILEPAVSPLANVNKDMSHDCNQIGQNQLSEVSSLNRPANDGENVLRFTLKPTVCNENVIEYKALDLLKCFEIEQRSKTKTSKDDKNPSNKTVNEQEESNVGMEQTGSDITITPALIDTSVADDADRQLMCPDTSIEKVISTPAANIDPAMESEDCEPCSDLQNTSKGTKRKANDEQITAEKSRKVEEPVKVEEQKKVFTFEGQERGRGQRRGRGSRGRGRGRGKPEKGQGLTTSFKLVVDSSLWGGSRGRGRGRGRKRGIGRGAATSLKQPLDSNLKGVSRGRGRGRKPGLGRGAASVKHTLEGSQRGSSRGRGRARRAGMGQRRGRGKIASLHQTLDSVLMQEDPDVDALTAHLNTYNEDDLTKKTISLKSLRHCLNKMKGKLKVPEKLKGRTENSEGEKCGATQGNDEREGDALNSKSHTASDIEEPENISIFQDGSDTACDLNKENVKGKNVYIENFGNSDEVSNNVADSDIGRSENSNFSVGTSNNECDSASDLNKDSVGGGNVHIENVANDDEVTDSISCQNVGSSGTAKVSCNIDVEVIGEIDEEMRSGVEENTDNCSKQTVENKSHDNITTEMTSENDSHLKQKANDGSSVDRTEITEPTGLIVKLPKLIPKDKERKEKVTLKSPNHVNKDTGRKSDPEMSYTFDNAHKATIVKFHERTVLLLSTEKGNFFLMKELLKRCFCKDITDKEERLKTKQNTLLIKEKQLNIPFKAMDLIFYPFVKNYFHRRKISRTLHSEVSVISEEDANRLFHVIYQERYCTNGCIVTDARNKVKTVQKTDSSCVVTDTSTTTSQPQGTVKDLCKANSESAVGSSGDLEHRTVNENKKNQNTKIKENRKDRNIFQWMNQETCKLPTLNTLPKTKEGDGDKDYDSDATYVYEEEEDDQSLNELNDNKKDSDALGGSGNTDNSKLANITMDKDHTETFEVYKENELVGVFKVNSPNHLHNDDNSKTNDEHIDRKLEACKIKAEGMKSDLCIDLTQSVDDSVIDLTEAMDDESADGQEDKGVASVDDKEINISPENIDKANEDKKAINGKSNNRILCSQTQELMEVDDSLVENLEDDVIIEKEKDTEEIVSEKHASELLHSAQNINVNEAVQKNTISDQLSTSNTQSAVESDDESSNIKVSHLLQDYTIDDDDVVEIQITVESKSKPIDPVASIQGVNEQVNAATREVTSNKHDLTTEHGPIGGYTTVDPSTLSNSASETDVLTVKSPCNTIHKEDQDSEPDVEASKSSDTQITMIKENLSSSVTAQKDGKDKSVNESVKDSELETKKERTNINVSAADAQKDKYVFIDDTTIVQSTAFISEAEETLQGIINKANLARKGEKCKEMVTDLYRELDDISKPMIEWSLRFVNMYKKSSEMAKDDSMLRDLEEIERTCTDWNGK